MFKTLSTLLFVFIINTCFAQDSYVHQGGTLWEVLEQLEADYDLPAAYSSVLKTKYYFHIPPCKSETLQELITTSFSHCPLNAELQAGQLLIREEETYLNNQKIFYQGQLLDDKGKPIEGANIGMGGSNANTFSDKNGHFQLWLPVIALEESLLFYHLSFFKKSIPFKDLIVGHQSILLEALAHDMETVVVVDTKRASNIQVKTDANSMKMHQSHRKVDVLDYSGMDILKYVQTLPGVAGYDDSNSSVRIRGSNADETLVVLDEIPIFKTDHFFGIFSNLNPRHIGSMEIFKNNLPIEYGGKTGGMLSVLGKETNQNWGGVIDINRFRTGVQLNVPISKRSSLLLNSRSSYTNSLPVTNKEIVEGPFQSEISETDEPNFWFYDVNAKWQYQINEELKAELNYFRSFDEYAQFFAFDRRVDFFEKTGWVDVDFERIKTWTNEGASFVLFSERADQWNWKTAVYYSSYRLNTGNSYYSEVDYFTEDGEEEEEDYYEEEEVEFQDNNQVSTFGVRAKAIFKDWEIGFDQKLMNTTLSIKEDEYEDDLDEQEGFTSESILFVEKKWKQGRFDIFTGFRGSYYQQNESVYWTPRIRALYYMNDKSYLKGSYNQDYQFLKQIIFENALGVVEEKFLLANDDSNTQIGNNLMLGAHYTNRNFDFDIEGYFKSTEGITSLAANSIDADDENFIIPEFPFDYTVLNGDRITYGLDFLLGWTFNNYQGHLGYTLSKSEERYDNVAGGDWFLSKNDRRHQLKLVNLYTYKNWTIGTTTQFANGRRYFDPKEASGNQKRKDFVFGNSELPYYFRTDLSLNYRIQSKFVNATLTASVFNVTGRENVKSIQYFQVTPDDPDRPNESKIVRAGAQTSLLSRMYNIGLRVDL